MSKRSVLYGSYILFLSIFTVFIGVKPYYGVDMLFYMAIILEMDGETSVEQVHRTVYQEAESTAGFRRYRDLVAASDYRRALAADEVAFGEQIPFYVIKPLYLALAFLGYKVGAGLLFAAVLPCLLAYFAIGVLLLYWIDRQLPSPWLVVWVSVAIVTSEPLVDLGKSVSPDALSTVLLLAGAYFFIEGQSLRRSTLFFALAILARPDAIILITLFFLIVAVGKWHRSVFWPQLLLCFLLCLGSYYVPRLFLEHVSWSTLFYHAFVDRLLYPLSEPQSVAIHDYWTVLAHQAVHSTYVARTSLLMITFFAGVVCWNQGNFFRWKTWTFDQTLMVVLVVAIALRFMLFPAFLGRFMAPFLVLSAIVFIKEAYRVYTNRT